MLCRESQENAPPKGVVTATPNRHRPAIEALSTSQGSSHLKEAPKSDAERHDRRAHEHLDAAAGVDGIEVFYAQASRMARPF